MQTLSPPPAAPELTSRRALPWQRFKSELGDKVENYENVKIPGPKNPYRVAAD